MQVWKYKYKANNTVNEAFEKTEFFCEKIDLLMKYFILQKDMQHKQS